jgi:hypothetical protein
MKRCKVFVGRGSIIRMNSSGDRIVANLELHGDHRVCLCISIGTPFSALYPIPVAKRPFNAADVGRVIEIREFGNLF